MGARQDMNINIKKDIPLMALGVVLFLGLVLSFTAFASAATITPPSPPSGAGQQCGPCFSTDVFLTTASGPTLIQVAAGYGGSCANPNPPHDSLNSTFIPRADVKYCNNMELLYYYAIVPNGVTNDRITCSAGLTTYISCIAWGEQNFNQTAPFAISSPVITSTGASGGHTCPAAGQPCVEKMNAPASSLVLNIEVDNGEIPQTSAGAGFTLIGATSAIQPGAVQYKVASGPIVNENEAFGTPITHGFIVIGDAIQGISGSPTSSSSSTVTTSSTLTTSTTATNSTITSSTSTTVATSTVTSTCTVTFTMSGGSVKSWNANC